MKHVAVLLIGNILMDGRVQKEIRSLRGAGHKITLIQWAYHGPPNASIPEAEVIQYPPPLSRSAAVNFLRQMLFNLFALKHLRRLKPDAVHCNDLNTMLAGHLFRRKALVVFDAHELFPESQTGVKKWIWNRLENWWVPGCRAFIQPEKNRLAYFARKHSLPANRIVLLQNFPSGQYVFTRRDRLRERFPIPKEAVILLYTGVLGEGRGIETFMAALNLLPSRFELVVLGSSFKGYQEKLAELGQKLGIAKRLHIHPPIPNQDMLDTIRCGDIGLVFYQNTNLNNYFCASNKLYEFLYCGKPVLTNDYPGLREAVGSSGLGVCLGETTPESVARAALDLAARTPITRPPQDCTWENQEREYLNLFN